MPAIDEHPEPIVEPPAPIVDLRAPIIEPPAPIIEPPVSPEPINRPPDEPELVEFDIGPIDDDEPQPVVPAHDAEPVEPLPAQRLYIDQYNQTKAAVALDIGDIVLSFKCKLFHF